MVTGKASCLKCSSQVRWREQQQNSADIYGALYGLQKHATLTVHPGGRTALSLLGKAHYLELSSAKAVLFGGDMRASVTSKDKEFLLSVHNVAPDWSIYDYERFPAVQWKLQNLQKLKTSNPDKHREQYEALKDVLEN